MGCSRGIVAVLVASVVSCGPPPPARPKAPPPLEVRTYEPLAFKTDARLSTQAVILGTDDKGGSTILPLLPAVASPGAPPASRASTPARAADWQPALVAAAALDKRVTDLDLALVPPPDAAASPALVGVRYLAAWTGATIAPSTTLVANLAPDGTLGPIADLAGAVRAAAASGHTRIAVASGQAAELAGATPAGTSLVEVDDLASAYRALTGKLLPATVPVAPEDMALDAETVASLEARYKLWQQKLAIEWAAILQLESAGRIPPQLVHLRDTSKALGQAAEQLRKKKLLGAAYPRVFAAVLYAQVANQSYDVLAKVRATRTNEALALLDRHATAAALSVPTLTTIGNRTPRTVGGHISIVAAFYSALRAWTFETTAAQAFARARSVLEQLVGKSSAELGSDETAQLVAGNVVPALLYAGQATLETTVALDQLELASRSEPALVISGESARHRAATLEAAAASELAWLDSVTGAGDAERAAAIGHEPEVLVARMLSSLPQSSAPAAQVQRSWENDVSASLMELARTELALASLMELRATYDWLAIRFDTSGSGKVATIAHERAFATMLAGAERAARMHAHAARVATGTIPVQARLAYQNAVDARTGSLDDQLAALAQFWASSAYSELAVMLARD